MPQTIVLEDENKKPICTLKGEFDVFKNCNLKQYKLLHYLDKYGDTVFNRNQMEDLISDLKRLKQVESSPLIEEILQLAELCKEQVHTYLVFYGD